MRTRDELLGEAIAALTEAALLPHCDGDGEAAYDDLGGFVVDALVAAVANAGGIQVAMSHWQRSPASSLVRDLLWQVLDPDRIWAHRTTPLRVTVDVDAVVASHHQATHAAWATVIGHADDRLRGIPEPDISPYAWVYDRDAEGGFAARDVEAPPWSWELWRAQPLPAEWADLDLDDFEATLRVGLRPHAPAPGEPVGANVLKDAASAAAWARKVAEHEEWVTTFERLRSDLLDQRREAWTAYGSQVATRFRSLAVDVPGLTVPIDVDLVVEPPADGALVGAPIPHSLEADLLEQAVRAVDPPPPPF